MNVQSYFEDRVAVVESAYVDCSRRFVTAYDCLLRFGISQNGHTRRLVSWTSLDYPIFLEISRAIIDTRNENSKEDRGRLT